MPNCPDCRIALENHDLKGLPIIQGSPVLACGKCGGSLVPITAVHLAIRDDIEQNLLAQVRATRREATRRCPRCLVAMTHLDVPRGPKPVPMDVCYHCESVWFDPNQYDVLQAMYGIEEAPSQMVDHKWKWLVAAFGMPVERVSLPMLNLPWLTWSLAGITTLVSLSAWLIPDLQIQLALVPAFAWRMGGVTLLTCFFLHGGLFHLASNMYFLVVFGEKVEDYLGRGRYLLLLLLATLAGSLLDIAIDPNNVKPLVGASGGISGLVVFYGLQFPRVRLLILTRSLMFFPLRLRAWAALVLWIFLQFIGAWAQVRGFSNVASLAHLGGAAAGLIFWFAWRNRLAVAPAASL